MEARGYRVQACVGSGSFGKAWLCEKNHEKCIVKQVDLRKMSAADRGLARKVDFILHGTWASFWIWRLADLLFYLSLPLGGLSARNHGAPEYYRVPGQLLHGPAGSHTVYCNGVG